MSTIQFKATRLRPATLAIIDQCNDIIEGYQAQGLRLTLRQLYYQLVTRNAITNEERSYKNLGSAVSDARLAGLMDWDAIEDRVRQPRRASEFDDLGDLVNAALRSYRLPRWADQDYYAELWVEKDALAGVLDPLAREHHVTLMVNRGYSSQSAMFEASRRFIARCAPARGEEDYEEVGRCYPDGPQGYDSPLARHPILFYLGDHDPSGEDMVRDVRERLSMFGIDVDVRKIALTTEQVRQYNPPPNPAKMSDSRAAAYVAKHGRFSWEVDALPPEVLSRIVRRSFASIIDEEKMAAVKAQEETDKAELTKAVDRIMKKNGKETR